MSQRPPVVGGSSEWTETPRPVPSSAALDGSVTPGISPATYSAGGHSSYFPAVDSSRLATPSPSAQLADPSNQPSALKDGVPQRKASLTDIDPRAAFPSLDLTGSVISAAFCVPYSLEYRKGSDWVSCQSITRCSTGKLTIPGSEATAWHFCPIRVIRIPLFERNTLEPHVSWMDGRDRSI